MRILVAGADGCIGSALVRSLAAAGHEVRGAVFARPPGNGECFLDLTRPECLGRLPGRDWGAVIHAAGLVDQSLPGRLLHSVNALGTRRLAAWARARGCRHFVFLSSVSVYGLFTMGQRRDERTPAWRVLAPLPYMRSKILAERYLRRSGLPYTVLRLPPVLGKGDSYLTPAVLSALLGGRFFFSGRGDCLVSVVTLGGLCRIMDRLLERGPLNAAYNCADRHLPWRELAGEYARACGGPLPERRRSPLSLPGLLNDKPALLLLTFSLFGAHFPDNRLHRDLPHEHAGRWQDEVAEAVAQYLEGNGDR